ncbi:lysophospholipid acyltransferase family protein [Rhodobacter flavimaris]|uniref:lysophospholipid acyltransferase family protein n=1 Tax=Rhodobacter flavimaris TaxID=2907145 RepID=UPI0034D4606A
MQQSLHGPLRFHPQRSKKRWLLFPLHGHYCRPFHVEGSDRLSSLTGAVLIVANHASHVDTLSILRALPASLRGRTAVAAAADYFFASPMLGRLASMALNAFAFSRSGNVAASFGHCGELADKGWSILIYPEGSRSPNGSLQPFKSGIGLLAVGLDLSVVPVGVTGGHDVLPKGARWPRHAPGAVSFGEAFRVDPVWPLERIVEEARARVPTFAAEGRGSAARAGHRCLP